MDIDAVMEETREMLGAGSVFGEPVERNGVTVIPAAKISGGAGGGDDEESEAGGGGGGGFGIHSRPAGALVIEADGSVRWETPFDRNKVLMGFQVVWIALIFAVCVVRRAEVKARQRAAIASAAIGKTAELVEHRLDS